MMNTIDFLPEVVRSRQAYLQSLASHPVPGVEQPSVRRWTGHALVRLGQWIEGRRPEERRESLAPLPSAGARLARVSR